MNIKNLAIMAGVALVVYIGVKAYEAKRGGQ